MENASEALIIAGGILIAVLIITLGVQIYITYDKEAAGYQERMSAQQIEAFNSDFLKYLEVEPGGTAQFINSNNLITIANYAEEATTKQGNDITITYSGQSNANLANYLIENRDEIYEENGAEIRIKYYRLSAINYNSKGRIISISFGSEYVF